MSWSLIGQNATVATRIQSPHSGRWRFGTAIGRRIRASHSDFTW